MASGIGRPRDLTKIGRTYGRLTITAAVGEPGKPAWLCQCACGTQHIVMSAEWGKTKSCGCLRVDNGKSHKTHGLCNTKAYQVWHAMRQRCLNPRHKAWHNYGGRGITVCTEWSHFEVFLVDMGQPPAGSSLDRIDNDQSYSKQNCRWATPIEQANNTRSNMRYQSRQHGVITLKQATLLCSHSAQVLHWRIHKMGMDIDTAMMQDKLRRR